MLCGLEMLFPTEEPKKVSNVVVVVVLLGQMMPAKEAATDPRPHEEPIARVGKASVPQGL